MKKILRILLLIILLWSTQKKIKNDDEDNETKLNREKKKVKNFEEKSCRKLLLFPLWRKKIFTQMMCFFILPLYAPHFSAITQFSRQKSHPNKRISVLMTFCFVSFFVSLFRSISGSDGTAKRNNDESWRDTTDFKNTPRLVNEKWKEILSKDKS